MVHKPEDLYREVRGAAPPDLFVYFGNLRWRSVGTVGGGRSTPSRTTPAPTTPTTPPSWACLIAAGPGHPPRRAGSSGMQLMDVTPTVLKLFGLDVPADLHGHAVEALLPAEPALR